MYIHVCVWVGVSVCLRVFVYVCMCVRGGDMNAVLPTKVCVCLRKAGEE